MDTSCGFCARAGFDECFCGLDPEETAESLGMSIGHYYLEEGITLGRNEERARLRPLLERAESVLSELSIPGEPPDWLTARTLRDDLRRELGLLEDGPC